MSDTDLVTRLRAMADDKKACRYSIGDYWNICDEAADEIERLNAALRAAREIVERAALLARVASIARSALR